MPNSKLKTSVIALEAAKQDLVTAEEQLGLALGEIKDAPRAEKTVSSALELALSTLRAARKKVDEVEETLVAEAEQ